MGLPIPRGPLCQSCAMPMKKPEDFGTNADGSRNKDYCRFCFQKGEFTNPDATMEQMIDRAVEVMATKLGMQKTQAKTMASAFFPTLKRWRK
ncbi:MAG: zinc ribbon domain-containing protein [Candidatus Bathyarchaeia archaeon]